MSTSTRGGGFLQTVTLDIAPGADRAAYPLSLPVVTGLADAGGLTLDPAVTFLLGDNGTGKSTLVEAIAAAAGFNPEGGSTGLRFVTRPTESDLHQHLRVRRPAGRRPRGGFFLRAESFFNVASALAQSEEEEPGLLAAYGGRDLHQMSHGESFLQVANERFHGGGLYILDEPEAALSARGQLALLARLHDITSAGAQVICATHSPILTALPGALLVQIDDDGLHQVDYDDAEPVQLTREFLAAPGRFLRHLLEP